MKLLSSPPSRQGDPGSPTAPNAAPRPPLGLEGVGVSRAGLGLLCAPRIHGRFAETQKCSEASGPLDSR